MISITKEEYLRLHAIEDAARVIDGIEFYNSVEIPIPAWQDLQKALAIPVQNSPDVVFPDGKD